MNLKRYLSLNENYETTYFHFQEVDCRSYELAFDSFTSYESELILLATEGAKLDNLKGVYRYADGLIVEKKIGIRIASEDVFGVSIIPVILLFEDGKSFDYLYIKIHETLQCLDRGRSIFSSHDEVLFIEEIVLDKTKIDSKYRVFNIDDEYSIVIDEGIYEIIKDEDVKCEIL